MDNDFAQNLANWGFATMSAGAKPGATTLGAIGQGGMDMNQAAQQRAQTQQLQMQNQLMAPQLALMNLKMQAYQDRYGANAKTSSEDVTTPSPNAGTVLSPTATNPGEPAGKRTALSQTAATRLAESGGNPYAISSKGAKGLMQIMPSTGVDPGFGVQPLQNDTPEENQRFGNDYLGAMTQRYADKPNPQLWAQVAYNAGPTVADKWTGALKALPDETQNYVKTIDSYMGGGLFNAQQPQQNLEVMPTAFQQSSQSAAVAEDPAIAKSRKRIESLSNKLDSDSFIGLPTASTESSLKAEQDRLTELLKAQTELAMAGPKNTAVKRSEIETQREAGYTKAQSALVGFEQQANLVTDNIDKALKEISPYSTGYGAYLQGVPNSQAGKLDNYLNTVRANIGFDKLQQMRDNSPTGGALGQVSDFENKLLQAVSGAIDPKQPQQLAENLKIIKDLYPKVLEEKKRAFEQDYGSFTPIGSNEQPMNKRSEKPKADKIMTKSDIDHTVKSSGKTRAQVIKAAKEKGFTVE